VIAGLSKRLSREVADLAGDLIRSNVRSNLPIIKACRGVRDLAGTMQGAPIVIAGAGPSLDEAIPVLSTHRPFIVAVDRAARPLLAAGIAPDWIVAVEKDAAGAEKMRGLRGLEIIPLVFHPAVTPKTVERYPGPLYTFDFPELVLGKGAIALGTGVITPAVGLAQLLGGSPIILAGVDCGFPLKARTHAAGVPHLEGDGEHPRFQIPSTDGRTVSSDEFMAASVDELASFTGNLIQTSPHGAMIPGWKVARLEDVL